MKRFLLILLVWVLCFVLLFFLYFNTDFYVIVNAGPRSWKKPIPLFFGERFFLSFIVATALTVVMGFIAGFCWLVRAIIRRLRKPIKGSPQWFGV